MRKYIFLSVAVSIVIIHFTSCRSGSAAHPMMETKTVTTSDMDSAVSSMADVETKAAMLPEENQSEKEEKTEQSGSENETDNISGEVPQLPDTGKRLEDFVPEGWDILDSVELDFNEDGIFDYIGVLEVDGADPEGDRILQIYHDYPRILFAIASHGTDGYCLDFQDINLIFTRNEGGVFGDPYLPLTGEGTTFATHAFGGSAWKWSEDDTYTYRDGTWWLTSSEAASGYGAFTTSYIKNNWEKGVGIRKERSVFSDLPEFVKSEEYDVVYELALDEPLTLEQAGKRCLRALDRVTDWEVEAVVSAADPELSEDMIRPPEKAADLGDARYCDEDCVLYTFHTGSDTETGFYYLAMYSWQDKVLSVLAKEESEIGALKLYDGKIYYSAEIAEKVIYKTGKDGEEQITEEEDTVGIRLNRIERDGTGKETVFEYRYQENGQEIMESRIPYLALIYEISGGEMIVEVYTRDEPRPFYRMKTDGSEQKWIGQTPKE